MDNEKALKCLRKVAEFMPLSVHTLTSPDVNGVYTMARGDNNTYGLFIPGEVTESEYEGFKDEAVSSVFIPDEKLTLFIGDAKELRKSLRSSKGFRHFVVIEEGCLYFTSDDETYGMLPGEELSRVSVPAVTCQHEFRIQIRKGQWMNVLAPMDGPVEAVVMIKEGYFKIVLINHLTGIVGILMGVYGDEDQFVDFSKTVWLKQAKKQTKQALQQTSFSTAEADILIENTDWEKMWLQYSTPEEVAEAMAAPHQVPENSKVDEVVFNGNYIVICRGDKVRVYYNTRSDWEWRLKYKVRAYGLKAYHTRYNVQHFVAEP